MVLECDPALLTHQLPVKITREKFLSHFFGRFIEFIFVITDNCSKILYRKMLYRMIQSVFLTQHKATDDGDIYRMQYQRPGR